jgi:hypothetical protein
MVKKIIKYLLITVFALVLFCTAAVIIIYIYYSDNIVQYAIKQINKNINVEVKIENASLDLFKNFPNASIRLRQVRIINHSPAIDTIATTSNVYLQFNLIELLHKKYILQGINLENGSINLIFDSNGKLNFNLFKEGDSTQTANGLQIMIHQIKLKDIKTLITTQENGKQFEIAIGKLVYNGNIETQKVEGSMTVKIDDFAYGTKAQNMTFRNLSLETEVNIAGNNLQMKGLLNFRKEKISFQLAKTANIYLISIDANNIDGKNFIDFMPRKIFQIIENPEFNVSGFASMNSENINTLFIKAKVEINDNKFFINKELNGIFSTEILYSGFPILNNYEFKSNAGKICIKESQLNFNGNLKHINAITNVAINGNGNFLLANFPATFDTTFSIKKPEGKLQVQYSLKYMHPLDSIFPINPGNWQYQLNGTAENVSFIVQKQYFDSLNFKATSANAVLSFNNLSGKWNGTSFDFEGNIGLNNPLSINGKLYLSFLNADTLLALLGSSQSSGNQIKLHLDTKLNALKYNNQEFKKLKALVNVDNKGIAIENFQAVGLKGSISELNFYQQNTETKDQIYRINANFSDISISNIFELFNNFNQNVLQSKQIEGKISGNGEIYMQSKNNKILTDKIVGNFNLSTKQIRMTDFAVLKDLMKYLNIKQPDDVRIQPFNAHVGILNNTFSIDPIDLHSSAIDFTVSGKHSFENEYLYHFKIYLSDVLKRQGSDVNNLPVTEKEDSSKKSVVYLLLSGKGSSYKISYDSDRAYQNFINSWQNEKKSMKSMLKSELGMFKNDTSIISKTENNEVGKNTGKPKVIFEEIQQDKTEKPKVKSQNKPKVEWKDDNN